ncbi:MAG: hypothetical protein KKE64_01720, partial [Candidatus Omnitrophica bacterium]|nr:hypothetical protein [Candidatus Omnitrophota bacterium]
SIVGFPRESRICLAKALVIFAISTSPYTKSIQVRFQYYTIKLAQVKRIRNGLKSKQNFPCQEKV